MKCLNLYLLIQKKLEKDWIEFGKIPVNQYNKSIEEEKKTILPTIF